MFFYRFYHDERSLFSIYFFEFSAGVHQALKPHTDVHPMSIKKAEAIAVSLPFDIGGPKPTFAGIPRRMEILFIRLENHQGLVGWGEAFGLSIWPATLQAFEHLVAPLVIDQDESDISGLMERLTRQLHILGRSGAVTYALSGLDIALWDMAGKKANQSIGEMLGGPKHTQLPAYASLMRYGCEQLVKDNSMRALNQGFKGIKLHETQVGLVHAARSVLGPHVPLMMDVNCPWSIEESLRAAEELCSAELYWLEEPIWPPEDFEALQQVRTQSGIRIAAGENNISVLHFEQMLKAQSVDFIQPSVTKIGGISAFLKVMALSDQHQVPLMPHSPYFGPGFLASLHLASLLEEEVMIEYSFADLGANPMGSAVLLDQGFLKIPQGPGLGQDPELDILREFRVRPQG